MYIISSVIALYCYSDARGTVNTQTFFLLFHDIFLTSLMLGNWQLANQGADNLVRRSRSSSVISITKSMATYQVKVKYGEERFSTFLIKDISFAKLMQAIKQNCSPLAHLPASNIRVRYRDEDGDMINLSEDPDVSSGKRSGFTATEKTETNGRGNAEFFSF